MKNQEELKEVKNPRKLAQWENFKKPEWTQIRNFLNGEFPIRN